MTRAKSGDLVAIYADESCIGNGREGDNPGGAGGLIEWLHPRSSEVTRCDYWISEPATTNNRMALRSRDRGISSHLKAEATPIALCLRAIRSTSWMG